jgi:Tfp pilus assembly pilus retraction ATPase PilT
MDTSETLERWLRILVSRGAADLFLVSGFAPAIRLNGVVTPLPEPPPAGEDIEAALLPILHPQALERCGTAGSADVSLRRAGVGRFRINLHRERGRAAATIRALPAEPPLLADLGLPSQVEQITRLHHGLVLVGGATGSGKTTTVAALVNEINRRDARHIVTIEDPIEYEHPHQKSVVEQVSRVDAPDFPTALRAALRRRPTSS